MQKLIGSNDAATTGSQAGDLFWLGKWGAEATGTVNQIRVKSSASGNVKVAIYADNAGAPGVLLNCNNIGAPVTVGWSNISIPSTPVVLGTLYWLGFISSVGSGVIYITVGGFVALYKAPIDYSGFSFPDPAGVGYSASNGYPQLIEGWNVPYNTNKFLSYGREHTKRTIFHKTLKLK